MGYGSLVEVSLVSPLLLFQVFQMLLICFNSALSVLQCCCIISAACFVS